MSQAVSDHSEQSVPGGPGSPGAAAATALARGMQTMRELGIAPEGLIEAMAPVDEEFADTVIRSRSERW